MAVEVQGQYTALPPVLLFRDEDGGLDLPVGQVVIEPFLIRLMLIEEHPGGRAGIRVIAFVPRANPCSQVVDVRVDGAAGNELKGIGLGIAHG